MMNIVFLVLLLSGVNLKFVKINVFYEDYMSIILILIMKQFMLSVMLGMMVLVSSIEMLQVYIVHGGLDLSANIVCL